jgi:hypothetical protein
MAIQNRGQFGALYDNVDKVVTALVGKNVKEIKPIYPPLFKKMSSDRKFERFVTSSPFGDVPQKPEGTPYSFDIIQQANTKDITPVEYGLGFEVTETADEDDQYDELKKKAYYLAFSMRQVEDKSAADVFNNGFTTQLTADGIALFSTAHTLKRGGTAKNRPSTDADLSVTSLGQAFIDLATDTKIESGQLGMPPTEYYLVVPAQSEFIAHRVVASTGLPGSADNDVNPVKARRQITIVVNPFLTDTDSWYLVPASSERHGLIYLERVGITMVPPDTDPRTGNRLYKLRCRKTWDSMDWRNTYGTVGA